MRSSRVGYRGSAVGPVHPAPPGEAQDDGLGGIAVPLVLETPRGALNLLSTTTVFGTPVEVTLSELAIEPFFPADAATLALLGGAGAAAGSTGGA